MRLWVLGHFLLPLATMTPYRTCVTSLAICSLLKSYILLSQLQSFMLPSNQATYAARL